VTPRPRMLMYCQHSVGLGHLVRSLALAESMAGRFEVTLLSGGPLPEGVRAPDGVEVVGLPPLGMASDHSIISRDGRAVDEAFALRKAALLGALEDLRPDVLVIELFPFGRRKFRVELLPLLDAATSGARRPLIACSLRDILVDRGDEQEDFDESACQIANRYFDAILLHADERLNRLEDSFRPRTPLRVGVHYTGFVVPGEPPRTAERREGIMVSSGGGIVGGPIIRAAVAAHKLRGAEPMRIVAGPFLPDDEWAWLQREAEQTEGLEAVRSVPNLRDELAGAALSISQCGYNTTFDLVRSGVPSLVIPYAPPGEDEQTRRARALERLGVLRVLEERHLDGPALAAAIDETLRFEPGAVDLRIDGGAESAAVLTRMLAEEAAA